MARGTGDEKTAARAVRQRLEAILRLSIAESMLPLLGSAEYSWAAAEIRIAWRMMRPGSLLVGWLFTSALSQVVGSEEHEIATRALFDQWRLNRVLSDALRDLGLDEGTAWQVVSAVRVLAGYRQWFQPTEPGEHVACAVLESWLKDGDIAQLLGVNRHEGVLWFHKESFERLLRWTLLIATVEALAGAHRSDPAQQAAEELAACYDAVQALQRAQEQSGYQVDRLLQGVKS